jgi:hypothetical protein
VNSADSYLDGYSLNAHELRWRDAGVIDFEAKFNGLLDAARPRGIAFLGYDPAACGAKATGDPRNG